MPPAAERRVFWGTAAGVVALDALTKWLAESRLLLCEKKAIAVTF